MMTMHNTARPVSLRTAAAAMLAGLSLLLAGCFITPGKFTSEFVLGADDDFTFTYDGEIFFLGLSQLAEMSEASDEFKPEPCFVDASAEERECTANELEGQRAAWEANAGTRAAEAKQRAEQMSALMGEIDPSDPEAVQKFIQLLERQKGWNRVVDKGDGVFDVSFRIDGKLTHDFHFPVIEGVPSTNPFVQVYLRDGGIARVNAPGFAAENKENPMGAMMGSMGALAGMAAAMPDNEGESSNAEMPNIPQIEGTFTILTTSGMTIRANNTDEGPVAVPTGEKMTWDITPRTKASPTALIDLGK